MKTALYTIFRCTNYGAVLQAFALARAMRAMQYQKISAGR